MPIFHGTLCLCVWLMDLMRRSKANEDPNRLSDPIAKGLHEGTISLLVVPITDEKGARQFCKKWGIKFPEKEQEVQEGKGD